MSKVRLYGSTSGYVELAAPAVAPDATLTLPPTFGGIGTNVVQAVKTDTFSTSSATHVDVTGLSVTITPSSATSKILVIVDYFEGSAGSSYVNQTRIVRDATVLYVGDAAGSRTQLLAGAYSTNNAFGLRVAGAYLDSPATTSATVYKLQTQAAGGGTVYINRSWSDTDNSLYPRAASSITAIEVAA